MTTKTTHTPGPWSIEVILDEVDQIERKVIAVEKGRKHITAICTWGGSPDPEADANARLIAMAPRMVDALKTCVEMLEWWASVDGKAPEACYSPDGAWEKARAILRALDTPDAPCPVSPESKEPCPVCGPVKR